jgi:hypothetical protein
VKRVFLALLIALAVALAIVLPLTLAGQEQRDRARPQGREMPLRNRALPRLNRTENVVGNPLSLETRGDWGPEPVLAYSYQWERCTFGLREGEEHCLPEPGARNPTYKPTPGDAGYSLRVKVGARTAGTTMGYAASKITLGIEPRYGNLYPQDNWWRTNIEGAAVAPDSSKYALWLEEAFCWNGGEKNCREGRFPIVNFRAATEVMLWAPPHAPTQRVEMRARKDFVPELQSAMDAVPVPPWLTQGSAGVDSAAELLQAATNREWGWYSFHTVDGKRRAFLGGALANTTLYRPGYYEEGHAGGWKPKPAKGEMWRWGASASGRVNGGGIITFEDFRRKKIEHGLGMALPSRGQRLFGPPGASENKKTDGPFGDCGGEVGTCFGPQYPCYTAGRCSRAPEGERWRLKQSVNCTVLKPFAKMVCEALKTYGATVVDKSAALIFFAQDSEQYARAPAYAPTGWNVYEGGCGGVPACPEYMEGHAGATYELLREIPWEGNIEVLRSTLYCGTPGATIIKAVEGKPAARREGEPGCPRTAP